MSKKDALRDVPTSFTGSPGKSSGAGLKPKDDYLTPAKRKAEPAWGSIAWRTARPGQEDQ